MDNDIKDLKDCMDKTIKAKEVELQKLNQKAIPNENEAARKKILENILPNLKALREGMDEWC